MTHVSQRQPEEGGEGHSWETESSGVGEGGVTRAG